VTTSQVDAVGGSATRRGVLEQPGGNVALDLFVLDQHVGTLLRAAFEGTGVRPAEYAVYSQLVKGARTPGQLIETLGVRPATLSGYLSAMEARGHVLRSPHANDRRSSVLRLTPAGRAAVVECRPRMRHAVRLVNNRLGGAEAVAAMRSALADLDRAVTRATGQIVATSRPARAMEER
jgi:DNA-binding MarR family transcriptional regulator